MRTINLILILLIGQLSWAQEFNWDDYYAELKLKLELELQEIEKEFFSILIDEHSKLEEELSDEERETLDLYRKIRNASEEELDEYDPELLNNKDKFFEELWEEHGDVFLELLPRTKLIDYINARIAKQIEYWTPNDPVRYYIYDEVNQFCDENEKLTYYDKMVLEAFNSFLLFENGESSNSSKKESILRDDETNSYCTDFNVYPNIVSPGGSITIQSNQENTSISLHGQDGNILKTTQLLGSETKIQVPENIKGILFLRMSTPAGNCFQKVMITNMDSFRG